MHRFGADAAGQEDQQLPLFYTFREHSSLSAILLWINLRLLYWTCYPTADATDPTSLLLQVSGFEVVAGKHPFRTHF